MSVNRSVRIECDKCGQVSDDWGFHTVTEARQAARNEGFVNASPKDYCAPCYEDVTRSVPCSICRRSHGPEIQHACE